MKDEGHLPRLSAAARLPVAHQLRVDPRRDRARRRPTDYRYGVAITSSFHPDARHPHRAGAATARAATRWRCCRPCSPTATATGRAGGSWLKEMWTQRANVADLYDFKHWSERTVIALVMQSLDNSITTYGKRGRSRGVADDLASRATAPRTRPGSRSPTRPYAGCAAIMDGTAGGNIGEPFDMPLTAHFIGGCAIGDSPETGVIDPYQRVYGHPGLHVADGVGGLRQPRA